MGVRKLDYRKDIFPIMYDNIVLGNKTSAWVGKQLGKSGATINRYIDSKEFQAYRRRRAQNIEKDLDEKIKEWTIKSISAIDKIFKMCESDKVRLTMKDLNHVADFLSRFEKRFEQKSKTGLTLPSTSLIRIETSIDTMEQKLEDDGK